jgi:nucleotide-binding universal stress UspA family protein
MSYAAIMVHAEADPEAGPRLRLAASLANAFDAMLIGVGAETIYPVVVGAFGEVMIAAGQEAVQADLVAAEAAFRAAAGGVRKGIEWRVQRDMPDDTICRHARAADLIVAGPTPGIGVGFYGAADPGQLLMESGRPILVAPKTFTQAALSRVVIGWKDTREARRAVADAMPLLERAGEVLVVEVCEQADASSAHANVADVAAALARHGVRASTTVRPRVEGAVVDELLRVADFQEADLLVIGGYGHSRMREWVFGGVTRSLLGDPPIPVLMSR